MSLDVYLQRKHETLTVDPASSVRDAIFIREDGSTKEISREEWDRRFPGREPVTAMIGEDPEEIYSANITHNLGDMAYAADLYYVLWRPEERGWTKASQLIEPMRRGLETLKSDPTRYQSFNPKNGWGDYDGLVTFTEKYLQACIDNPDADVHVSR